MNKNRFFIFSTCILYILTFLIAGCGHLKTVSSFSPPEAKLAKYKALEIADFETQVDNVPKEALTKIPDEIAKLLASKRNAFQKVERSKIEDVPAEDTLILLGEVTDYESGKSFKTKEGAIKFGEASLSIHIRLIEKATENEIASGEVSGSSSIGFLKGGSITKGVYNGLAEEIVKSISQNH
jgi:ribosomal protein L18E